MAGHRILIVDDHESVRKDFEKILCPQRRHHNLEDAEALIFAEMASGEWDLAAIEESLSLELVVEESPYELDFAINGIEGLSKFRKARAEGRPYVFVFSDVVMPLMDGIQMARHIWEESPETEIVLVTAHADYKWEDIVKELGESSRLVIIKKPFDRITIKQMAITLTEKKVAEFELKKHRDLLAEQVARRTAALVKVNKTLEHKSELLESINRHYETLFDQNEVSIWYEDFSPVLEQFDRLHMLGISDLKGWLDQNQEAVEKLVGSITVSKANEATLRMFRADSTVDFHMVLSKIFNEDHLETFKKELIAIWNAESDFRVELTHTDKDGNKMFLAFSMAIPRTHDDFRQVPISVRDITKQKRAEEILKYQAYFDDLTKLANKKLFQERLEQAVEELRRKLWQSDGIRKDPPLEENLLAVMFIDLDGFKGINDNLGHYAGDQLLYQVAQRLTECCKRRSDTAARLGGDEFSIILPNLSQIHHAEMVGRRVLEALNQPFDLQLTTKENSERVKACISGSIGLAIFPTDATDAAELVEKADTAMYKAKHAGKNALKFFTPEMEGEAIRRRQLELGLNHALETDALRVHYQPIVQLNSGSVMILEALIRWQHPSEGLIMPEDFVPIAEDTGLISQVDQWVLRKAMQQWSSRKDANSDPTCLAINLSNRFCRDTRFREIVIELIQHTGMDPCHLILEISESVFLKGGSQVREALKSLRQMGVRMALDDFGTGPSSLTDLTAVPFDILKIDNSIIADAHDQPLIPAIIAMAHQLNMTVVAEGTETAEQVSSLRDCGCDLAQGYFFSHAIPELELQNMLAQGFFKPVS